MSLADKLRKAREQKVEAGDFVFDIRRPTDLEMIEIRNGGSSASLLPFVIGWAKKDGTPMTEIDMGIPGGDPHPLKFDSEACSEWLSDRPDLFGKIMEQIAESYTNHVKKVKEEEKN